MKKEIEEIVRYALTEHFTNDETTAAEIIDEATDQLDKLMTIKTNKLNQDLIESKSKVESRDLLIKELEGKLKKFCRDIISGEDKNLFAGGIQG